MRTLLLALGMIAFYFGANWGIVSLYQPKPMSEAIVKELEKSMEPQVADSPSQPVQVRSMNEVFAAIVAKNEPVAVRAPTSVPLNAEGVKSRVSELWRALPPTAGMDERRALLDTARGLPDGEKMLARQMRDAMEEAVSESDESTSPTYSRVLMAHQLFVRATSDHAEEALEGTLAAVFSQPNKALQPQMAAQFAEVHPELKEKLKANLEARGLYF